MQDIPIFQSTPNRSLEIKCEMKLKKEIRGTLIGFGYQIGHIKNNLSF